jgi:16S rRNA (uracil1498-N3)-methyltransferase
VKQFLLPSWYGGEKRISLAGGDYRYLARVLRMRQGSELAALDARGGRYRMRIVTVGSSRCEVELAPDGGHDSEATPAAAPAAVRRPDAGIRINLLQCLPKGRKIDLIVRQATEAGVSRIVLLLSEHSLVKAAEDDGRQPRLARVAREAIQQSGTQLPPEIVPPRPLTSITGTGEEWGVALFFHEKPVAATTLHGLLAGRPRTVSVLIGPEGGLAGSEVDFLVRAGFMPVHLGGSVLRVETAALYALGAVKAILQERDAWKPAQEK